MLEVQLPDSTEAPELVRSFGACLASVTEAWPHEVPLPAASFHGAVDRGATHGRMRAPQVRRAH
jgi:hypothetical protein